jgi:lytic murein transglycosylase
MRQALKRSLLVTIGSTFAFLATSLTTHQARAQSGFGACLETLKAQAIARHIQASTFDKAFVGIEPDMKVIELMQNQPEFKIPIWDYLATLVDDQKVAEGRDMLRRHASTLAEAERLYGVDRHTIVAVWGVESDYGQTEGRWPLVQSLATGACFAPRRQEFFRGELISTLLILQRGDVRPERLRGSWAGAFGHTQFIPSTYLRLAVDGDGDGRRDLVDSIPDALHSTANFMKRAGWASGAPWGYEVRLPPSYDGPSGRKNKQPLSSWSARGITRLDGSAVSGLATAGLLVPAGSNGPAFLVSKNYDAAFSYNGADSYALAISLLSDRLRGRSGIQTPWPTDDSGLSRAERRELQTLLVARGLDIGGPPNGAIGAKTRAAIEQAESQLGLKPTGRPGQKILQALRR